MATQLGFIQRFAIFVRNDVSYIGGRKWALKTWRLIKRRAQEKDSEPFYEIEHLDLIAKNFWIHCRKDFTGGK